MQTAPKPILIHCQAGADRTGLAAMLYLQQIAGIDEEISERQLSVRYGHIGLPYISAAFAMKLGDPRRGPLRSDELSALGRTCAASLRPPTDTIRTCEHRPTAPCSVPTNPVIWWISGTSEIIPELEAKP
nr:tyrosine-protein phosphatase [Sinorhizobium meliloti]